MKRIAVFADGTWSSPERSRPTNVLRMARGVMPQTDDAKQVVFYDWGVGSDRKPITGGLTGAGIDKNIMDCYRFLVHNYDPGDELYFFGFSRGAYTARSLAGFIRNCGLLKREHAERIVDAFRLYRKRTPSSAPSEPEPTRFRADYAVADITPIEFVGAWDTVGSLGIPVPFWGNLNESEFLFHDTEPSKIIQHARHAVSIDEDREDFQPVMWDDKPGMDIRQVWFAGSHTDVGGGYRERGLSDCSIEWIAREATRSGLGFEQHFLQQVAPDPTDRQHNGRRGMYRIRDRITRTIDSPVHRTVRDRWQADSQKYRTKSRAMKRLLHSVDQDWSRIEVEE